MCMTTEKLSISLQSPLITFIEGYKTEHNYQSRSEVISDALKLLQKLELEHCYKEASSEIDPLFDCTTFDGLEDETW